MGGPLPLGFFIGGPFNAAQHIARQPAPQCLAPWPPGRGRQTCFGPHSKTTRTPVPCPMAPWPGSSDMLRSFKYIKRHSGPYLSESVCHAMFSYTFIHEIFRQSSDTGAARALLRKKCYVFFTRNCQTVSDTRAASALLRQKCFVFKKP